MFKLNYYNHLRAPTAVKRTEKPNAACYNASRKSGGGVSQETTMGQQTTSGVKIDSPIRIRRLMRCFEPPSRGLA